MEYTVFGNQGKINFSATGVDEVLQNVRTILATKKHSVPLDREFGLDYSLLDRPLPRAQTAMRVEIIEAIRKYEPRAKVTRIDFDGTAIDGYLAPKVTVSIDV